MLASSSCADRRDRELWLVHLRRILEPFIYIPRIWWVVAAPTKSLLDGILTHSIHNSIISDQTNYRMNILIGEYSFTSRNPNNKNGFLSASQTIAYLYEANWASNIIYLVLSSLTISPNFLCFWSDPRFSLKVGLDQVFLKRSSRHKRSTGYKVLHWPDL